MADLPITMRDTFFSDPFFRSTWDDFDRLHEQMTKMSEDFWNFANEEVKHMALEDKSKSGGESKKSKEVAKHGGNKVFPRRWMLPRLFGHDTDMRNSLDIFKNAKDHHEVRIQDDEGKFEVSLDTHDFRPEELKINVKGDVLGIEAKHEEKSDNRYISRSFHRQYTLPKGCEADKITSNMSKDGILVITAPKNPALMHDGSRNVPITHEK